MLTETGPSKGHCCRVIGNKTVSMGSLTVLIEPISVSMVGHVKVLTSEGVFDPVLLVSSSS
jgi:hypothetical protein